MKVIQKGNLFVVDSTMTLHELEKSLPIQAALARLELAKNDRYCIIEEELYAFSRISTLPNVEGNVIVPWHLWNESTRRWVKQTDEISRYLSIEHQLRVRDLIADCP